MEHHSKQQAPRKPSKRLSSQVEAEYKKLVKLTKMNRKLELAHANKLHAMKLEHFPGLGRTLESCVLILWTWRTRQQLTSRCCPSFFNLLTIYLRCSSGICFLELQTGTCCSGPVEQVTVTCLGLRAYCIHVKVRNGPRGHSSCVAMLLFICVASGGVYACSRLLLTRFSCMCMRENQARVITWK